MWYVEVDTHTILGKVLLLDRKHSLPIPLAFESEEAAQKFIDQGCEVEDNTDYS
ncbi:hypothetical protein ACOMCU_00425 [Lysinibacillus sp. UGB7]|uniref:hypothetical protein n=1 Tax=Lysinibacillus sp. UGB7 TaxID=3411039 RepID=UPI003B7C3390